jgi:hypothetical protein
MTRRRLGSALAGIIGWTFVAALALFAVDQWDPLWGFFPVAAAVIGMWAMGEWARMEISHATE